MDKLYGWTGKLLRADLSAGTVTIMDTQAYLPAYVGGLGIAARIAWDELQPGVGPFDPENMLFLMVGPLTGTVASGAGRVVVAGIAPQQYPSVFSRSGVGGHWGAELKYAGFDGVIVVGRAEKPTYLWIEGGADTGRPVAELREAGDLWGRGTFSTSTVLRQRHGPATRVMSCGPAGENLCRVACIQTETGNAAGQGGYGAVMGSKRLKAIAVRGRGGVPVADPGRLMELALGASREGLSYRHGERVRRHYELPDIPAARHRKKCGFCASHCSSYRYMAAPNRTSSGSHTVQPFCYSFRQEHEAAVESAALAGDLGINGWEVAYGIIPWLQMCKQQGLIEAFDGIDIPVPEKAIESLRDTALVSVEFSAALLHKMATREGELGDALADGACYAAERLFEGRGLPLLDSIYPRRGGQTSHWNAHWMHPVRFPFLIAPWLQWCVDTRDPASDAIHGYAQHMLTYLPYTAWGGEGAVTLEQARGVCEIVYGEPDACDPAYSYDKPETKIVPAMYHHHRGMINNCMVLCERETIRVFSMESESYAADTALMAHLYEAATGEPMSEPDLDLAGERVFNLLRAIDVRNHGRARKGNAHTDAGATRYNDWATVEGLVGPLLPDGIPLDLEQFSQVLDRFYEARGWNPETGWPTRARLERLGLGDVADGLERVGRLGAG